MLRRQRERGKRKAWKERELRVIVIIADCGEPLRTHSLMSLEPPPRYSSFHSPAEWRPERKEEKKGRGGEEELLVDVIAVIVAK